MYTDPAIMSANAARIPGAAWERRAERREVALLVRYAWKGLRGTVMLKDLTCFGARMEGLEALRQGDGLTLLLPDHPAIDATVAWAVGRAAGLAFERPIAAPSLDRLVRDFAPSERRPVAVPEARPHAPRRLCA